MSANVEFTIQAFDEASTVFNDVSSNAQNCFTTVSTGASEAADNVSTSTSKVATATESSGGGFTKNAMAMGQVASGAASLVMGINNVENAQVTLDRAHVTVEKDTNAVTSAQNALNTAVAKYGADSPQAALAASKLSAAQDALSVAHERVDEAQRNVNDSMMMFGVSVIPSVVSVFSGLSTVITNFPAISSAMSGAVEGLSGAFEGLDTSLIVVVAVVAIGMALYEAYEHCAPFRNAINEIGAVLGGAFKTALTAVENAVSYLWNNIFKPFGEFLAGTFTSCITGLETVWNTLSGALTTIWNTVLVPIANFFKGVFTDAINIVMTPIDAFESAITKISGALKPLTGFIGDITGALKGLCFAHAAPAAEEFNNQVSRSIELSNNLTNKLDPLKQGLLGVSGGVGNASVTGLAGGTQHITVNPTINIGKIDRTTGLNDVINAVNQGTAQALQRRF